MKLASSIIPTRALSGKRPCSHRWEFGGSQTHLFKKSVSVQYEEFDATAFFEEIMPFVRTPHRLYRQPDEKNLELLIGVSHPILMKVVFDDKNKLQDFIKKIRAYGFRRGDWNWV